MIGGQVNAFGMSYGTWNIGDLNGKGEDCEEMRKMMVHVCCLQHVGWRIYGSRELWVKGNGF